MRILGPRPGKRAWRLYQLTWPDGRCELKTGYLDADPSPYNPCRPDMVFRDAIASGAVLETIKPPVIEAAIRLEGLERDEFYFEERDHRNRWKAAMTDAAEILKAVTDGRVRLEAGWLVGRFTFKKSGNTYLMHLHDEPVEALGEAPAGAVDLSDLVASLGPAKA